MQAPELPAWVTPTESDRPLYYGPPWLERGPCPHCGEPADYDWEGAICIVCFEAGYRPVSLLEKPGDPNETLLGAILPTRQDDDELPQMPGL